MINQSIIHKTNQTSTNSQRNLFDMDDDTTIVVAFFSFYFIILSLICCYRIFQHETNQQSYHSSTSCQFSHGEAVLRETLVTKV